MLFMERDKLLKCLVSFLFSHNPPKKIYFKFYQNVFFGYFSEDIKMWPSHNVLNW